MIEHGVKNATKKFNYSETNISNLKEVLRELYDKYYEE